MTTIVRAAGAAQLLSFVPHLLDCHPARSLVVVALSGARSLGALRVDLPPAGDRTARDAVAATAIGLMCRIPAADGLVAVVYTDAAAAAPSAPHELVHRELIDAVVARADACGLAVRGALLVAADGWASYRGEVDLRPLSELSAGDAPVAGRATPAGDQREGARLPEPAPGRRRAVAQSLRSLDAALALICGIPPATRASDGKDDSPNPRIDPAALEAACRLDDLPTFFEHALQTEPAEVTAMTAAMIGWCLERPSLRDVALVQWASDLAGGDVALEAQRRWEDGEEYPSDLASVLWGEGVRPDAARIERALALVREVTALLPKRRRAGGLAVCAWLSWALGRSTHADRYARLALQCDRTHGLADIVRSFVAAAHLPDWAFSTAGGAR
ncbi:MAG: DUF4192 family protein [Microbacterium sp.]